MYAPTLPSVDFSEILNEIESTLKIAVGEVLLAGDFNAHSQS